MRDLLPDLPDRFVGDDQLSYTLKVLVTGEYLDDHANRERTAITFRNEQMEELGFEDELVSRHELNKSISAALRSAIKVDLKTTNDEKYIDADEAAWNPTGKSVK